MTKKQSHNDFQQYQSKFTSTSHKRIMSRLKGKEKRSGLDPNPTSLGRSRWAVCCKLHERKAVAWVSPIIRPTPYANVLTNSRALEH